MNMKFQLQVPHPGFFIKEELETRGWIQRDLAFILGVSEQSVNAIISGKRGISTEMAKALASAFSVSPDFFLNLQKAYDLSKSTEPDPAIFKRARLQENYPVREMIKRGWLEDTDAEMLEVQMARFFRVNTSSEIPHIKHAAKKTIQDVTPPEQLAWLYRVKQIAESLVVETYTENKLKGAIELLKQLRTDPEEVRHVPKILAKAGIKFVVVETLPKAKIDGACFWLDKKSPVIGMSLRMDKIDNFWFVLRHEIEHVLRKHGLSQDRYIIDTDIEGGAAPVGSVDLEEKLANTAGADFCATHMEFESFYIRKHPYISEADVLGFAAKLGVHPGLVVGQIHNKTKRFNLFRKYLVKIRHLILPSVVVDGWGEVAPVEL